MTEDSESDTSGKERVPGTKLSPVEVCPNCGGEEVFRDLIRDPPGTVHCEDCEKQIRLPDKRPRETKAREELSMGLKLFLLGCVGLWFLSGIEYPEPPLYWSLFATAYMVTGCLVLVGYVRAIVGVFHFGELSILGDYNVETRLGPLSLADLAAILVAGLPPGAWMWYSRQLGPVEAYLRGISLLITMVLVLAIFDMIMPTLDSENSFIEADAECGGRSSE